MNHSYNCHLDEEPGATIACETQTHTGGMVSYPVLRLGDAAFFPTREQLKRIGAAVLGWLAANPDKTTVNTGPTCDLCGIAVDGDNLGQSTWDPVAEDSTILCQDCTGKAQRRHAQNAQLTAQDVLDGKPFDLPESLSNEAMAEARRRLREETDKRAPPWLPDDLKEEPLASAPNGATYCHLPSGQRWTRKGEVWVADLPF